MTQLRWLKRTVDNNGVLHNETVLQQLVTLYSNSYSALDCNIVNVQMTQEWVDIRIVDETTISFKYEE